MKSFGGGKRFIPEFFKPKRMRRSQNGHPWQWDTDYNVADLPKWESSVEEAKLTSARLFGNTLDEEDRSNRRPQKRAGVYHRYKESSFKLC